MQDQRPDQSMSQNRKIQQKFAPKRVRQGFLLRDLLRGKGSGKIEWKAFLSACSCKCPCLAKLMGKARSYEQTQPGPQEVIEKHPSFLLDGSHPDAGDGAARACRFPRGPL